MSRFSDFGHAICLRSKIKNNKKKKNNNNTTLTNLVGRGFLACLPACLLACPSACLAAYLLTIYCDLSDNLSPSRMRLCVFGRFHFRGPVVTDFDRSPDGLDLLGCSG
ncbi:hypothetical protein BO94DRAFT_52589 [Aspergillus sclerotioniger CBS 115572]|uniref:Uncharacterized protein n=1 Tax=Aspergillus sclerotioniger CBS 115572 TaxID=1450535 RepID=A0A317WU48_9EURO|nr:hypothetical protein BO94DRAFT_52589 [Aspergillus sclerotioniger CBS 115572]PWY88812.1 hypothetical protein BO94DRAFT_52589 [Aspergillus sclerotioniger CBS 115572]